MSCWNYIAVIVLYFSIEKIHGQTFQKVLVEDLALNAPTSIIEEDSCYIVSSYGYTQITPTLSYRRGCKLSKFNYNGELVWHKNYSEQGKTMSIGAYGSLASINEGYLICGDERDTITNDITTVLMKFDKEGELQWIKKYPVPGNQPNWHGSLTSDSGYIMIGEKFFSGQPRDYYVIKVDSNGNVQWEQSYGEAGYDLGLKIHQTSDGGYILSGESESFGARGFDLGLIKTDSVGGIEWTKTYGTALDDRLRYVSLSQDGGYIVWGQLDTVIFNTQDQYAALIMKLDENGDVVWRRFFNHKKERVIFQVRELDDGSIVAVGSQQIGLYDSTSAWIAKLSANGDVLWERFYVNENYLTDTLYSIASEFNGDFQYTTDNHFIIAGNLYKSTETFNGRTPQIWLVKLDSTGCMSPDSCGLILNVGIHEIQPAKPIATIVAYPNPFTTQALISVKADSRQFANEKIQFQLFDVSGRLLQESGYALNQYGYCEFYVRREHYPAGIYFYRVTTQKAVLGKGKLIAR